MRPEEKEDIKQAAEAILAKDEHKQPRAGRVVETTDDPDPDHEDQKTKGTDD